MRERYPRNKAVRELIALIGEYSASDRIMFGQQNAGHIGISIENKDGTDSDCKRLTGCMPAVVGIDTLSLTGYEGTESQLVKTVKNLARGGSVITLSAHMPDFSLGGDGYYDYSAMSTANDCGRRIMPGGDLNAKYLRFLDMIADFTGKCIGIDGEPIPMIFRPFHECNGNWFWWGAEYLTPDEYKELFRYTIDYLCGERGVRNFAFCYSPNGPLTDRSAYISRYPGDEYVDIVGLDYYNDNPRRGDGFFKSLASSLDELYEVAQIHGKIPALTETGYRALETKEGYFEGLAPSGNANRKWFTDMLSCLQGSEGGRRCAYMLIWANFSDQQFWLPYVKGEFRHEMCDNLEAFAADPGVVMAPVEGLT